MLPPNQTNTLLIASLLIIIIHTTFLFPAYIGFLHFCTYVIQFGGLALPAHAREFYITVITQCGPQYWFEG